MSGTATLVSVEEYLSSHYEPDCDYVDGVLENRNVGEWDHSRLQALLVGYFLRFEKQWRIKVVPEQRVQVSATRFRIPDLTIIDAEAAEPIIRRPPLLCVEILSPEDRLRNIVERARDYCRMGVPDVWIIDPQTRESYTFSETAGLHSFPGPVLTTTDGRIRVDLAEIGD